MNCSYDNCFRPVKYAKKQLCNTHYAREWRTNNPEAYKEQSAKAKANYKKNKPVEYSESHRRAARNFMARNAKNPVTEEHITDNVKQRFFAKVEKTDTCWNWTGAKTAARPERKLAPATKGYGALNVNRRPFYVHRLSFLMHKGPLTPGLVIDHLCNNTLCVNPDHLAEVTNKENSQRSPRHTINAGGYKYYKTHCKRGHERPEELRGKACPECYELKKKSK